MSDLGYAVYVLLRVRCPNATSEEDAKKRATRRAEVLIEKKPQWMFVQTVVATPIDHVEPQG